MVIRLLRIIKQQPQQQEQQQQQQQLPKYIFRPHEKMFKKTIILIKKTEVWSADFIDKSSVGKYNCNYNHVLTVIEILTKQALQFVLEEKK